MEIISIIVPLIVTITVFLLKMKLVKTGDGKKSAQIEMIIDIIKFIIPCLVLIFLHFIWGIQVFSLFTRLFDIAILLLIVFVFLGGNHSYQDRKAIGAIFSFLLILITMMLSIFSMIIGTFSESASTYLILFVKAVISFLAFTWATFTVKSGSLKSKTKDFVQTIIQSFKQRDMSKHDYFLFGILSLFMFTGDPYQYFTPVALFGIHEILNRKYIKGSTYIVVGNIILFMQSTLLGEILFMLYTLIAVIDLIIQFFKFKK